MDPQWRMNLIMKEAVKKDILKCLDKGIIYLIMKFMGELCTRRAKEIWDHSDKKWCDELVPTRIHTR